jgi:hypothetical protein
MLCRIRRGRKKTAGKKKESSARRRRFQSTYSSCLCWGISGSQWYLKHCIGTLSLSTIPAVSPASISSPSPDSISEWLLLATSTMRLWQSGRSAHLNLPRGKREAQRSSLPSVYVEGHIPNSVLQLTMSREDIRISVTHTGPFHFGTPGQIDLPDYHLSRTYPADL